MRALSPLPSSRNSSTPKVTAEEKILFQQTFQLFDKDGDGYIGRDELYHTLTSLGNSVTLSDMDIIMNEIHTAKKGVISFEEFCSLMKTPSMDAGRVLPSRRKSIAITDTPPKRNSLAVNDCYGTQTRSPSPTSPSQRRHSTGYETSEKTNTPLITKKPPNQTGFSLRRLFGGTRPKSPMPSSSNELKTECSNKVLPKCTTSTPSTWVDQAASVDDMREVFATFDINKDGFLSVNEFRLVSTKLGIGIVMDHEEIRQLFNTVDSDNDGLISFDEFLKLFNLS
ncbi:hypothetical protein C9374_005805 [Naegleria lovaniensis]|uniref:EF-hand domain-containing protein n=1 Tax=Naegleria lovaniensis TaxID=51637 RepID=A0AA88GP54_NAELO|nr:uncharacterized protein C9374_005805 [Naegleria lovaniensis]KAG2382013.1 hypothetical protein C9374_005805 [Naegleria lovaniensis]